MRDNNNNDDDNIRRIGNHCAIFVIRRQRRGRPGVRCGQRCSLQIGDQQDSFDDPTHGGFITRAPGEDKAATLNFLRVRDARPAELGNLRHPT